MGMGANNNRMIENSSVNQILKNKIKEINLENNNRK